MKTILKGRREGKTNELIRLSAETGYYIVVATQRHATEVFLRAKEQGAVIPFPVSFDEFLRERSGPGVKGYLIDDADLLLQRLSSIPILAITLTQTND